VDAAAEVEDMVRCCRGSSSSSRLGLDSNCDVEAKCPIGLVLSRVVKGFLK